VTDRPGPPLARRLALAVGVTVASLLLAELAVRALGLEPAGFAETRHLESADKRLGVDLYPTDPDDAFPLDLTSSSARAPLVARIPELEAWAERSPHAVLGHYSAELCRVAAEGDVVPPADPARARVVFVGDSFIEGQGVPFADVASEALALSLGQAEVLDCGRRGYDFVMPDSATDERPGLGRWMRRHVLDARVVVYAMTLNDAARSEAFQAQQSYVDDWIVDRRRMLGADSSPPSAWSPRLLALLDDRLEALRIGRATVAWYREMVAEPNADGWRATLDDLEAFSRELVAEGRTLVVALWPLLASLEGGYPFEDTHDIIARDLAARGLAFVDTLPAFRGATTRSLWVHEVDHHPNAEAHRRFAEAIAPAVREALARTAPSGDSAGP